MVMNIQEVQLELFMYNDNKWACFIAPSNLNTLYNFLVCNQGVLIWEEYALALFAKSL